MGLQPVQHTSFNKHERVLLDGFTVAPTMKRSSSHRKSSGQHQEEVLLILGH